MQDVTCVWVTALCCTIENTESFVECQESSFGFNPFHATGLSMSPENIKKSLVL